MSKRKKARTREEYAAELKARRAVDPNWHVCIECGEEWLHAGAEEPYTCNRCLSCITSEQEHRARTLAKSAALSAAFDGAMITEGQGLLRALLAELDRLRGASIVSDGNWMQDAVRRFHVAMKQPHPETLDLESVRVELRAKLILEEALETVHALGYRVVTRGETVKDWELVRIHAPNWPEAIDGMCDTIYVVLGTAVEAGFKLAPFFAEIQRSNMTKVGGPVREDGKVLKPDTWEPPRIKFLWARVLTRAQRGQKTA